MTKTAPTKRNKKPVNLTLSKEAVRMGDALIKARVGNSLTNVVENLILDAAEKNGLKPKLQAA